MLLPERTVTPVEVTVTTPAVAVPPLAMTLLAVKLPAPAMVRVLLLAEVERSRVPVIDKAPPATDCQVEFPLVRAMAKLNVCTAVALLVTPPLEIPKTLADALPRV